MASKDIQIVIAEPIHSNGILELAENVYEKNEPVSAAMATPWEEVREAWEQPLSHSLQSPLCSHIAINSSNKVIGFRISRILETKNFKPQDSLFEMTSGVLRTILDQVTKDWAKVLVDDEGQLCKKILQFVALCVHPDFGGRGLGEKLCRENLANGAKLGCDYCLGVGSNWMSQRIFEKLGFRKMGEIEFDEYKDDIQIKDTKQKYSRAYFLKLEKFK